MSRLEKGEYMENIDKNKFEIALKNAIQRKDNGNGIGSLGEKTLHSVLKYYFEPDKTKHEVRIGRYFADIINETGIIEIQTRSFNVLRKKLAALLEDEKVTLVYPIPENKWLIWIDKETGETTKKRKSPKRGRVYDAFYELYKIKHFLRHPNLRICIVMLDVTEYRNLDGWSEDKKKGSSRYERIPESINGKLYIDSLMDYEKLIPSDLPEHFTSRDYRNTTGLSLRTAQIALNVLKYVGGVNVAGKQGNAFIYNINSDYKTTKNNLL